MRRLLLTLLALTSGLVFTAKAEAFFQTTTATMNVTGTIVAACTVSTAPLDFGTLSMITDTTTTTTITVNCSSGVPYRIDIDAGQNVYNNMRLMKAATAPAPMNTARYFLYQDAARSIVWGDNGLTFCPACMPPPAGKTGTGTGTADIHTVYATAYPTGNALPDSYSDTVTVTVNY